MLLTYTTTEIFSNNRIHFFVIYLKFIFTYIVSLHLVIITVIYFIIVSEISITAHTKWTLNLFFFIFLFS